MVHKGTHYICCMYVFRNGKIQINEQLPVRLGGGTRSFTLEIGGHISTAHKPEYILHGCRYFHMGPVNWTVGDEQRERDERRKTIEVCQVPIADTFIASIIFSLLQKVH